MSPIQTIDPLSPAEIIASADAEIQEAESLINTLEDRVRTGDDAVKPDQLEKARGLHRFALLRREAATKRAAQAAEAEDRAKFEQFMDRNLSIVTSDDSERLEAVLSEARSKFEEAIEMVAAKNRAIHLIAQYGSRGANYQDERLGSCMVLANGVGVSFDWDGREYSSSSVVDLLRQTLAPLRSKARSASAGVGFSIEETF